MQPIDLGSIDAPDPAARDWRALERVTTVCAVVSLLFAIAFGARLAGDIAGPAQTACAPAPGSQIPSEARRALARLIEEAAR